MASYRASCWRGAPRLPLHGAHWLSRSWQLTCQHAGLCQSPSHALLPFPPPRVPWQTEDSALTRHFSQYGAVEDAQIMRERYSGKSRGFGFVTFASPSDARTAVASEHVIDGRKCEAKFALPEGKVRGRHVARCWDLGRVVCVCVCVW